MNKRVLIALGATLGTVVLGAVHARLAFTDDGQPVSTGPRFPTIVHRGATLPPPARSGPAPLVIGLHGSGTSPSVFEHVSGLDAVADEHGFVVAYLSSPMPTSPAWTLTDMPANLAYVSSEISRLTSEQNIDPNRVFVTGFSAGATMSFFVGCQLSSRVAGIAPVSGAMRFTDPCTLAHPVSELSIIGTNDVIPINGSARLLSADAVAERWRGMNSCTSQSSSSAVGPVTATAWNTCNDSSGVGLNVVSGGTHQWPRGQYNAAEAIWAFFAAHPGTPTTAPSARLSSLAVRRSGLKRSVRAVFNVPETAVALRVTLTRQGHLVASKALTLARTPNYPLVLQLPVKAPGGRYSLTVSLADSYGRRATVVRTFTVPAQPAPKNAKS